MLGHPWREQLVRGWRPCVVGIVLGLASHRNARALDKNCEVAALRVGFRTAKDQPGEDLTDFPPPRQPEDRLVASQLEFVAAPVSSPRAYFRGLEGDKELQVGTLSRGHLGYIPSLRKEARKFLLAAYLDCC